MPRRSAFNYKSADVSISTTIVVKAWTLLLARRAEACITQNSSGSLSSTPQRSNA